MSSSSEQPPTSDTDDSSNVGVAFGLVLGAGAATAIGASVVFFPSLVKLASRRVLAAALGLSAGVMTYVSFVEIFQKSNSSFLEAGHPEQMAYVYATLCFFAGVVTMIIIDVFVKCLSGGHHHHHEHHDHDKQHLGKGEEEQDDDMHERKNDEDSSSDGSSNDSVDFVTTPHCACVSEDPLHEWDEWKKRAEQELQQQQQQQDEPPQGDDENNVTRMTAVDASSMSSTIAENVTEIQEKEMDQEVPVNKQVESEQKDEDDEDLKKNKPSSAVVPQDEEAAAAAAAEADAAAAAHENRRLIHMGINTALAIGLHNFPEGLATFVAALDDPRVGAVLAVAIGIHNIPEGLCVALPIYYATGNRCKAFLWACVSGVSEPIAALLGWAVLANSFSNDLYAILFGIVSGMMVVISTKELVPTAHRYDPDDTVVTYSYIAGMCIMALSLVLFAL